MGGAPIIVGGGGGGSLFGLLFFGFMMFMVLNAMRGALSGGARGLSSGLGTEAGSAQALSVQVLLSEGDEVKQALQEVARRGDPDTDEGLARMIQEAALVVLRHPDRWTYGDIQQVQGSAQALDAQVGGWATQARAAFTVQTTSNYQNNDPESGFRQGGEYADDHGIADLYLAVTIAVAAHALPGGKFAQPPSSRDISAALQAVSSVTGNTLIRGDVVWSPDAPGEFLSEDEAIQKYPRLTKI
ncbi:DUF1517 domain-containing protein [Deinococcus lacus]|uniref:DUF1517 domain-containing protein n=1 Tax=Deinococcus lacus TaxID=392561 RepID=A0ABW1YAJ4_9DEIO